MLPVSPKPTEGWVYIVSHPVWRNLGNGVGAIKIGKTRIDPRKRALQIGSASGLLRQPTVEWCAWVADCGAVEAAVHRHLNVYRISKRRELFAVPVANARAVIEGATHVKTMPPRRDRKRWRRAWLQRILIWCLLGVAALVLRHSL